MHRWVPKFITLSTCTHLLHYPWYKWFCVTMGWPITLINWLCIGWWCCGNIVALICTISILSSEQVQQFYCSIYSGLLSSTQYQYTQVFTDSKILNQLKKSNKACYSPLLSLLLQMHLIWAIWKQASYIPVKLMIKCSVTSFIFHENPGDTTCTCTPAT